MSDPAAAPLVLPPLLDLDAAAQADHFLIMGDHANLWFEPRQSDTLIVSFDNLATIDEGWPRGPWLSRRLAPLGHSVLGVQSHAKDWFRQPTAPALLRGLAEHALSRCRRRDPLYPQGRAGLRSFCSRRPRPCRTSVRPERATAARALLHA